MPKPHSIFQNVSRHHILSLSNQLCAFYILFRNGRVFFLTLGQKQISRNQYGFHRLLAGYGSGIAMKTLIDHAGKKLSCFTFYHGTVARGWKVTLQ